MSMSVRISENGDEASPSAGCIMDASVAAQPLSRDVANSSKCDLYTTGYAVEN
jgi:hypothetical protein